MQHELLGLVCDVRLHRARNTLSVSSSVEVVNSTAADLLLRPPPREASGQNDGGAYGAAITVRALARYFSMRAGSIVGQAVLPSSASSH